MRAVRVRGRHFNGRQPSGLHFDCEMSLFLGRGGGGGGGGGLMRRIKTPQQDFVLKMQGGGAYTRGGVYLRDTTVYVKNSVLGNTINNLGIIGASLSEPHTSVTGLAEVVCMFVAIYRKF